MDDSWLTLILLGISASFMPLVFGLEIALLGSDDGVKRVSSLVGGITVFRVLAAVGVVLLFAGGAVAVGQRISNIGAFLGSTLSQFGQDVASGQHVLLDILLVAAGILLMVSAYRHIRGGHGADQSSEHEDSIAFSVGVVGMLGVGFAMAATNVKQWVFTATGVNQILRMQINPLARLFAFIIFLIISSIMMLLPIAVVVLQPQRAQGELETINGWIHGVLKYVVAGVLFLIGLYFLGKGVMGVEHYLDA